MFHNNPRGPSYFILLGKKNLEVSNKQPSRVSGWSRSASEDTRFTASHSGCLFWDREVMCVTKNLSFYHIILWR